MALVSRPGNRYRRPAPLSCGAVSADTSSVRRAGAGSHGQQRPLPADPRPIAPGPAGARRSRRRLAAFGALAALLALTLSACFPPAEPGAPILATSTWVGGLNKPWDLAFLPTGTGVYTENDTGRIWGRFSDSDRNHLLGQVQTFVSSPAFDNSARAA